MPRQLDMPKEPKLCKLSPDTGQVHIIGPELDGSSNARKCHGAVCLVCQAAQPVRLDDRKPLGNELPDELRSRVAVCGKDGVEFSLATLAHDDRTVKFILDSLAALPVQSIRPIVNVPGTQ
jgi:hypothetical protein